MGWCISGIVLYMACLGRFLENITYWLRVSTQRMLFIIPSMIQQANFSDWFACSNPASVTDSGVIRNMDEDKFIMLILGLS